MSPQAPVKRQVRNDADLSWLSTKATNEVARIMKDLAADDESTSTTHPANQYSISKSLIWNFPHDQQLRHVVIMKHQIALLQRSNSEQRRSVHSLDSQLPAHPQPGRSTEAMRGWRYSFINGRAYQCLHWRCDLFLLIESQRAIFRRGTSSLIEMEGSHHHLTNWPR